VDSTFQGLGLELTRDVAPRVGRVD
jgi:hypothetical protein